MQKFTFASLITICKMPSSHVFSQTNYHEVSAGNNAANAGAVQFMDLRSQ